MTMISFIIRRVLQMMLVLLAVSLLVFIMNYYGGGDPIYMMLPQQAGPDEIAEMRRALGLDRPVFFQYAIYLSNLLQGNLGNSWSQGRPVSTIILERLPATLELACVSMFITLLIGISLGLFTATKPISLISRCTMTTSILGISIPPFWLGIMFILIFSVVLGFLPSSGRGEVVVISGVRVGCLTFDGLMHLILPALTMAVFNTALLIRLTRATMMEELLQDYVRSAKAKGVPLRKVVLKHAFRNALIPIVTFSGLTFGQMIAFAVITETIFAWPGMGKLLIDSINLADRPVVIGYLLFIAFFFSTINLLTDITYSFIDPRIRIK
jgi:peptide/nickel transport system permease protein